MTHTFDVAAVIFDNDGTLVNSRPGIVRAWVAWAEEHGVAPERLVGHDGRSSIEIVEILLGTGRADLDAASTRVDELEEKEAHDTVVHGGVREALAALPPDRIAIATAGTRAVAAARLAAAEIAEPPVVVTADDITRAKPDPEIFLLAAERLGVPPGDCLVVEDAPYGVTAGKAAGCAVLAVTTTAGADKLTEADAVVSSLDQVTWELTDGGRLRVTIVE